MTAIASIVTDLAHSRMLKEAGWPQKDSTFFFYRRHLGPGTGFREDPVLSYGRACHDTPKGRPLPYDQHFAAPTAEDILRRLPKSLPGRVPGYRAAWKLYIVPHGDGWKAYYMLQGQFIGNQTFREKSLANALAQLYIYLSQNNLLPTEA